MFFCISYLNNVKSFMHIACQAGCYYFIFHLSYPKCPLGVGTRELLFGIVKA